MMDGHTPRIFKASEIEMKHNYASLDISKDSDGNVNIEVKVRTLGNVPIISRKFRIAANLSAPVEDGVHSLNFRHAKTRHSAMCKQTHRRAKRILMVQTYLETIIVLKDLGFVVQMTLLFLVFFATLPLSILIRVFALLKDVIIWFS